MGNRVVSPCADELTLRTLCGKTHAPPTHQVLLTSVIVALLKAMATSLSSAMDSLRDTMDESTDLGGREHWTGWATMLLHVDG